MSEKILKSIQPNLWMFPLRAYYIGPVKATHAHYSWAANLAWVIAFDAFRNVIHYTWSNPFKGELESITVESSSAHYFKLLPNSGFVDCRGYAIFDGDILGSTKFVDRTKNKDLRVMDVEELLFNRRKVNVVTDRNPERCSNHSCDAVKYFHDTDVRLGVFDRLEDWKVIDNIHICDRTNDPFQVKAKIRSWQEIAQDHRLETEKKLIGHLRPPMTQIDEPLPDMYQESKENE